ncbi:MAG: GyrI-like domain-containing protein [Kordiimonas sp.]
MSYIHQINRAIDYIEANLHDALPVEKVAREAGLSKWYFQTVFHAVSGETLKSYTLSRRLSSAAHALRDSDRKIVDLAFDFGFASHEVFSRAFKRTYGLSPSRFRTADITQVVIPSKPRITTAYLTHLYNGMTMQPQLTTIEAKTAIGFVTTFKPFSGDVKLIPDLWQKFRENIHKVQGLDNAQRVGVIGAVEDEAPTSRLEYLAGAVWDDVDDLPDGFTSRNIPTGEYAEFTHIGPVSNFPHTINYIYGSWFPKSGRIRADGPEFVLCPKDFNPNAHDATVQIYIPLS